jgi:hypothetical protein
LQSDWTSIAFGAKPDEKEKEYEKKLENVFYDGEAAAPGLPAMKT